MTVLQKSVTRLIRQWEHQSKQMLSIKEDFIKSGHLSQALHIDSKHCQLLECIDELKDIKKELTNLKQKP